MPSEFMTILLRRRSLHLTNELLVAVLFLFLRAVAVGALDAELFESVLERAKGEAEELGGLRDVVVGALHRLQDEVALHVLEVDALRRELETRALGGGRLLADFEREVFDRDVVGPRREEGGPRGRLHPP